MKNLKKMLTVFLTVSLLLCSATFVLSASSLPDADSDGYYEIATAEDFAKIAEDLSGKYELTANITLTAMVSEFQGSLNGNQHTITLNIESTSDSVGLFGKITGNAVVENLTLEGTVKGAGQVGAVAGTISSGSLTLKNSVNFASVTGTQQVGGFVGRADKALTAENLINRGTVTTSTGDTAGGILGTEVGGSTIKNCQNYAVITSAGSKAAGILAWDAKGAQIQNCANFGNVTCKAYEAGGIVGDAHNNTTITNGFNAGSVKANVRGNGISAGDKKILTITNCLNIGSVTQNGGAIAVSSTGVTQNITNCYYLDTCGTQTAATAKTDAELKADAILTSLGDGFAFQRANSYEYPLPVGINYVAEAEWTVVRTAEDFAAVKTVGKYMLMNDIVLPKNHTMLTGFAGILNGNGHTITVDIDDTANVRVGLFSTLADGSEIKNLTVDGTILAKNGAYVGSLAGEAGNVIITNCVNKADCKADENSEVGGLIGRLADYSKTTATIDHCINLGEIGKKGNTTGGNFGGMVARGGKFLTVKNCVNYGDILGNTTAKSGGMVGWMGLKFENCANFGKVAGNSSSGGIIGSVQYTDVTVKGCMNVGIISGAPLGGLVGKIEGNKVTVSDSYDAALSYNALYSNVPTPIAPDTNSSTAINCVALTDAETVAGVQYTKVTDEELKNNTILSTLNGFAFAEGFDYPVPDALKDELVFYNVTIDTPVNGTVSPSASYKQIAGSRAVVNVQGHPAEGYRISTIKINDVPLITIETDNYVTLKGDTRIAVIFEEIPASAPTLTGVTNAYLLSAEDGCGSITYGTIDLGYKCTVLEYGICYSKTNMMPTVEDTKLSGNAKNTKGQFGVKLLFTPVLEAGAIYYTRTYVTYQLEDTTYTIYGDVVTTTIAD